MPAGRVAAVDFGTVRIGLAISDARRQIASPLETYTRGDAAADAARFRRLVAEERVAQFVVGLPVHGDGRESTSSVRAVDFGRWLLETTGIAVDFLDERFTTQQADRIISESSVPWKKRKALRDKLAAQILLTAYIERGCRGTTPEGAGPLDDSVRERRSPESSR